MSNSDISLEPLFNQSTEGSGSDKKIAMVPINTVGVATHKAANAISTSEEEITITAGMRTLEMHNSGTAPIYYGGTGVASTTGIPLFPNQTKVFANVKDTFSIFVLCAAGESSTLKVVEYD